MRALLLAIMLMLPLMKGWMWYRGDEAAAARYRTSLSDAQGKKDYAKVQLLERKLAQLGQDTRLSEFNTAKLLERDGKINEAYERLLRLAPRHQLREQRRQRSWVQRQPRRRRSALQHSQKAARWGRARRQCP